MCIVSPPVYSVLVPSGQVWDLRKLKTALAAFAGLDNFFDTTAAVFGPGDEYFMTGTSVRRAKDGSAQVTKPERQQGQGRARSARERAPHQQGEHLSGKGPSGCTSKGCTFPHGRCPSQEKGAAARGRVQQGARWAGPRRLLSCV